MHVVPDFLAVAPLVPISPAELDGAGAETLRAAEAFVRELAPDLSVEAWLRHGSRPVQLVLAAEHARVLVLGRDERSLAERLVRGDTTTEVAARASVPVVEVPSDWRQLRGTPVVVVGVKNPEQAPILLADAFAVAQRRGARLVVLHAWDDAVASTAAVEGWVRGWRLDHPTVPVQVRVIHDHPKLALVDAAREADLVVIGRRAHGLPAAVHLGITARTCCGTRRAPVRVVPPQDRNALPGLRIEEHGALAR